MDTGSSYIAVGNRCAVDFSTLRLPFSDEEAIKILLERGFNLITENLTALARQCVGISKYVRFCRAEEAPNSVDCSSFVKWLYAQKGIWLPRHPIDQRYLGFQEIADISTKLYEGDLIFSTGRRNLYWFNPEEGIGHVGMVSSNQTLIHAANPHTGVVELPLTDVIGRWQNRGIIRIIPNPGRTFTFECPAHQLVECSTAFRWKLLSYHNPRNL